MAPAPCAFGSATCFSVVNASGLDFESALQVAVAQGLTNRRHGPTVYVFGMPKFDGMVGIEWFPGTGCSTCAGVRERWLATLVASSGRRAVPVASSHFLELVRQSSLFAGGALYSHHELHSLGPVMTACGIMSLLPATSVAGLPRGLEVRFDGRHRWPDATAAAWFVARRLLPLTNRSTLALQAPTELPFLADAIVAWQLPMLCTVSRARIERMLHRSTTPSSTT